MPGPGPLRRPDQQSDEHSISAEPGCQLQDPVSPGELVYRLRAGAGETRTSFVSLDLRPSRWLFNLHGTKDDIEADEVGRLWGKL